MKVQSQPEVGIKEKEVENHWSTTKVLTMNVMEIIKWCASQIFSTKQVM